MGSRQQYDEKELQKREEKAEEKSAEEKSYDEKYRRDPLGTLIWGIILVWAGIVFLADSTGIIDRLGIRFGDLPFDLPFITIGTWQVLFAGIGVLLIIEVAIRLLVPAYRTNVVGKVIGALVMLALAFGQWGAIWPLVLIAIGLSLLLGGIVRRRD